MNRECCGDYFVVDGIGYYRCLLDGTVLILKKNKRLKIYSNCKRMIFDNAENHGILKVEKIKVVHIPHPATGNAFEVRLPN